MLPMLESKAGKEDRRHMSIIHPCVMTRVCDPNTGEIETEESRVPDHSQPHGKFGSSLGYMRPFIKTSKIKINRQ